MLKRSDIRIRDPFILRDDEEKCYYMYGTTALENESIASGATFSAYRSYDLESFDGPVVVVDGAREGFLPDKDFWAPEVHFYNGRYYLFGSCKSELTCRGTYIFVSDTPLGRFVPLGDGPITPKNWECLDGTLFVEDGVPYLVFCHEWSEIHDGEILAVELSRDLTHRVGEPFKLFSASENPWVSELSPGSGNYVTDGPYLYREGGVINMIWSSFYKGRYLVIHAKADSIRGKWVHGGSLFDFDGGHAMLFESLSGERMISLHSPNRCGEERAFFYPFPKGLIEK